MILGIDIGGANTKITEIDENYKIHHIYFPMWKNNEKLTELLKKYSKDVDAVGIVMTAELVDAYETKKEGVDDILNSVENAYDCPIYVLDADGNFLNPKEARDNYLKVSAANWTATAKFVSEYIDDNCILVDMGSTTTDIIPIKDGKILANKTDLDRLMNNELIYVGTLRTPLSFLANKINFRGKLTHISSEYFAITGDINVILGKIKEEDYTCETPDGKGVDKESCLTRIARVLCGDREMIGDDELTTIAEEFYAKLLELIREGVDEVSKKYELKDVVITGLGENILKDALKGYNIKSIEEVYGKEVSLATPSFAVGMLLKKHLKK
ncbi:(4-{4-[2-(gamma-L-glutamylamino)ethyl]phenoxymethyl}furan-2-yl)methanamine synthase [Methanotorris formicicus]|uniref:H4MPT-linked C1 transfer pathway protein n=1 Tax=Methanotorris formicicus Mc-S-70 TaxID=647171 RepID=H1KYC7_9EURY|nr:(4-{4-[2-(gamma-L-glutamylamino)ethyl]phenoxymethyl}furan-2-yl)methanamine synthase [Methanotorris formicicus]EHP87211.1 H4MPT-linked C1 transfer pathway protein [Methanotorris formicicus Mc-S-70]